MILPWILTLIIIQHQRLMSLQKKWAETLHLNFSVIGTGLQMAVVESLPV